jgi:flagellar operon protein
MKNIDAVEHKKINSFFNSQVKRNVNSRDTGPIKESFGNILSDEISSEKIRFSQHAMQRISSRNINITGKQLEDLDKAVRKASDKGIKDSLVLLENTALIVSIRNKTVVTAMESSKLKDGIVTNIDGTIII